MKNKIVFYAHNLELGGIEKALVALLNNIDYKKYDITLILEKKEGVLLKEIPSYVEIKEYSISKNKIVLFRKIKNRLKLLFTIIKNYNKYDFSCCYVPYSIPGPILMRCFSKNNSIWVHTDYYELYKEDKERYKIFFNNRSIEKFNKIIMISNEAQNSFIDIYPNLSEKTVVCGNIVDYDKIIKLSKEKVYEKKDNKYIFINVSRHEEDSKKLTRLIDATKRLANDRDDFEVWMIGDGEDSKQYKDLVKKHNLEDKIKFLGMKKNPYPYYKKADAILLTSDYEGFPVVYLEALIFNINIITTIVTSNSIFNIKDYALICQKNPKSIYEGMKKSIDNKIKTKKMNINKYNEQTIKTLNKIIIGE